MKFGYEGLGLFYTTLEKLAKQEKPINTDVLKVQLKVGKRLQRCWSFMEEIGILSSSNGETFNEQLLNFSEKYQIKKEKTRKKVSEWREKQSVANSVTSYVPVSNPRKVKESKVKESKETINCIVEFLNDKTGKLYKASTKKTSDLISARINDGFKISDFEKVIEIKSSQWLGTDMEKYLRPETLFGNKFESYLNESPVQIKTEQAL